MPRHGERVGYSMFAPPSNQQVVSGLARNTADELVLQPAELKCLTRKKGDPNIVFDDPLPEDWDGEDV